MDDKAIAAAVAAHRKASFGGVIFILSPHFSIDYDCQFSRPRNAR
jgi:hypothetical protein